MMPHPACDSHAAGEQQANERRGKILVVDDRPRNLLAIETALKRVDAEIVTARSGNEALSLVLRHDFALVLLDVQMPDMDGFEVATLMRENDRTKQIPIIFVTAISKDDEYVFRGYETGAVDYLFKPLNPEILQAKVRVFLDVHRQKRELEIARREADAANLTKSEFLANMSHEIRTPMTAILGFAETLMNVGDIEQAPPQRLAAIRTILRNGEHLLNLINGILDLSKIEAGKLKLEYSRYSPLRIAQEVISLMQVRADAKGLTLALKSAGTIPETIRTDPTQLRQILINLVGNAVKFTEIGQVCLEISLARPAGDDPMIQFSVTDTGIGIAPDRIACLFQPFSQVDASTTRRFGGTGLGLAISKRLADRLGGDVTVTSEVGKGSSFRVTVATGPLDDVAMIDPQVCSQQDLAATREEVPRHPPLGKLDYRILLAEDGPDNQRLISFVLTRAGAQVTVAENGRIACEKAARAQDAAEPFDVILMDVQMPVLGGLAATRKLRQGGYTGPIVALTAHAMDGDRDKCVQAGCDDYASKPINREDLLALVSQYGKQSRTMSQPQQAATEE